MLAGYNDKYSFHLKVTNASYTTRERWGGSDVMLWSDDGDFVQRNVYEYEMKLNERGKAKLEKVKTSWKSGFIYVHVNSFSTNNRKPELEELHAGNFSCTVTSAQRRPEVNASCQKYMFQEDLKMSIFGGLGRVKYLQLPARNTTHSNVTVSSFNILFYKGQSYARRVAPVLRLSGKQ